MTVSEGCKAVMLLESSTAPAAEQAAWHLANLYIARRREERREARVHAAMVEKNPARRADSSLRVPARAPFAYLPLAICVSGEVLQIAGV